MTEETDILIAQAIAECVLNISPAIVPKTTLAQIARADATALHLADASRFTKGGRLIIWDYAGERVWTIKDVDYTTNIVTLQIAGLDQLNPPIEGLLVDHALGATVSTNLLYSQPGKITPMLAKGDPVIFVSVREEKGKIMASRASSPLMRVILEVRRTILQAEDDAMDVNDWTELQEFATRNDLNTIQATLLPNRNLNTSQGPHIEAWGDGAGSEVSKAFGQLPVSADNQQFVGIFDAKLRAAARIF